MKDRREWLLTVATAVLISNASYYLVTDTWRYTRTAVIGLAIYAPIAYLRRRVGRRGLL